ncbi:MAG TPA: hypothetical protein VJ276_23185 [Thermoanaerobaculia bacterium]|nr:hypothetical protein [Thermoanaerobaculia bacterium]
MKTSLILILALVAFGCKVEKTGEDTYKVVTPTPEAKAAAEKAKEQAKVVGKEVKEGAAKAAEATGTALQKAGREVREKTTTTTTTTTGTTATTTTTTTTTTTRH